MSAANTSEQCSRRTLFASVRGEQILANNSSSGIGGVVRRESARTRASWPMSAVYCNTDNNGHIREPFMVNRIPDQTYPCWTMSTATGTRARDRQRRSNNIQMFFGRPRVMRSPRLTRFFADFSFIRPKNRVIEGEYCNICC